MSHADRQQSRSETLTEWRAAEERRVTERVSDQETQLRHFSFFFFFIINIETPFPLTEEPECHLHHDQTYCRLQCVCVSKTEHWNASATTGLGFIFLLLLLKKCLHIRWNMVKYLFICCSLAWVANTGFPSVSMGKNNEKKEKKIKYLLSCAQTLALKSTLKRHTRKHNSSNHQYKKQWINANWICCIESGWVGWFDLCCCS